MHKVYNWGRCLTVTAIALVACLSVPPDAAFSEVAVSQQAPERTLSSHASQIRVPGPAGLVVNTWNGNLYTNIPILHVPSRGLPLLLALSYNSSRRELDLHFGRGWQLSYSISYVRDTNGDVIITWEDGRSDRFVKDGGSFLSPLDSYDTFWEHQTGRYTVRTKYGIEYVFNSPVHKRLSILREPNGNEITFTYNSDLCPITITDSTGRLVTLSYTTGHLTSVTDSLGRTTQLLYDGADNLTSIENPLGHLTTYAYDAAHLLTGRTDARGTSASVVYSNNAVVGLSCESRELVFAYDDSLRQSTVTATASGGNHVSVLTYDELGRVVSIERTLNDTPTVVTRHFTWDARNNLIELTDELDNTTTFAYDDRGNRTQVSDALGNTRQVVFESSFNKPVLETDELDSSTSYAYDSKGNLVSTTDKLGVTTSFSYDSTGQLTQKTDADGTTTYAYDGNGNLILRTDPLSNTNAMTYDGAGNLLTVTDANGLTTTRTYDAMNRLLTITDPLGRTTTFAYDEVGNLASLEDPLTRVTTYSYDGLNRLIGVTDPLAGSTSYTYDEVGNLTQLTDATGNSRSYVYDRLGRLVSESDGLGQSFTYTYDDAGNRTTRTDANGVTTSYSYDPLNRLIGIDYPGTAQDATFTYDAAGRRTLASTAQAGRTTTYDALGQPLSQTLDLGAFTKTINATYDNMGRRATMTDPDSGITTYVYDAGGRLTSLTDPTGTTTFSYDAGGRLEQTDLPNGAYTTFSYDDAGQILSIAHRRSDDSVITTRAYTYDDAGNMLSTTDPAGVASYTYDALDRLSTASYPVGGSQTYTYDAAGNRLSLDDGTVKPYTYDNADRMLTAGSVSYTWDANGNLLSKTEGSDTTTYSYDAENRLTGIGLPDGTSINHIYDADGGRVTTVDTTGTTTCFVADGPNVLLETNSAGTTQARYTSSGADGWLAMTRGGSTSFFHSDSLRSVVALTNASETEVATYRYDAFGVLIAETGAVSNPYRYAGRRWNADSGLYHFRARQYDPTSGRFTSRDPVQGKLDQPRTLSPYVYTANNPGRFQDPYGLLFGSFFSSVGSFFSSFFSRPTSQPSVTPGPISTPPRPTTPIPPDSVAITASDRIDTQQDDRKYKPPPVEDPREDLDKYFNRNNNSDYNIMTSSSAYCVMISPKHSLTHSSKLDLLNPAYSTSYSTASMSAQPSFSPSSSWGSSSSSSWNSSSYDVHVSGQTVTQNGNQNPYSGTWGGSSGGTYSHGGSSYWGGGWGSGGGGGGGVESKPLPITPSLFLSPVIASAMQGWPRQASRAPVHNPRLIDVISAASVPGRQLALTKGSGDLVELADVLPVTGPEGTVAQSVIPPGPIGGATNAVDALAIDFVDTETSQVAATVFATKSIERAYEHDYPICNRFHEYQVESAVAVELPGILPGNPASPWFWYLSATQAELVEETFQFAVFVDEDSQTFTVDSQWLHDSYQAPPIPDYEYVLNFQIWAAHSEHAHELLRQTLVNMDSFGAGWSVAFDNTSEPTQPTVLIKSAQVDGGTVHMTVQSWLATSQSLSFYGSVRYPDDRVANVPFDISRQVEPGYNTIDLPLGAILDGVIQVSANGYYDRVYVGTGSWFIFDDAGGGYSSTVSLETPNCTQPGFLGTSDLILSGCARITGEVDPRGWIGLARTLNPNGRPVDISQNQALTFFARGDGKVYRVLIETDSVGLTGSADFHQHTFTATSEWRQIVIPLTKFTQRGWDPVPIPFTGTDVKAVIWMTVGGPHESYELEIDGAGFFSSTVIHDTTHLPDTADTIGPYPVASTITDDLTIDSATLHYSTGTAKSYTTVPMSAAGNVYSAAIPGQPLGSMVHYYVETTDADGNVAVDPPDAPFHTYQFQVSDNPYVLVDDFSDTDPDNVIGGDSGLFGEDTGASIIAYFDGSILHLDYDVSAAESYAGYTSDLEGLDLIGYNAVSFDIRSDYGGEQVKIGFKDGLGNETKILVGQYLRDGLMSSWQRVTMPLTAFVDVADWSDMATFVIAFEQRIGSGAGSIEIDDIHLENLPGCVPIVLDNFNDGVGENGVGRAIASYAGGEADILGRYAGSTCSLGQTGSGYSLTYSHVGISSWAAFRSDLGGLDASAARVLSFAIRGDTTSDPTNIYLVSGAGGGEVRSYLVLGDYLVPYSGWQLVEIPLADFAAHGVDLGDLTGFEIVWEWQPMSGSVCIDNIRIWDPPVLNGHWRLDEPSWNGTTGEVIDSSPWGHDGTAIGGVSTIALYDHGRAGSFDGFDDYVAVPSSPTLDPGNEVSVSAWIRPAVAGQTCFVAGKSRLLNGDDYGLLLNAGRPGLLIDGSSALASTPLVSGRWAHIAGTFDEAGSLCLWVDGKLEVCSTEPGASLSNNAPFTIGATGLGGQPCEGTIDDVTLRGSAMNEDLIRDVMDVQSSYPLFIDGFESGDVSVWTRAVGG